MSPRKRAAILLCCLSLLVSAGVVRFVALPDLGTWRSKILIGFGGDFGHRGNCILVDDDGTGAFSAETIRVWLQWTHAESVRAL
ncbi:hypothetical protein JB92DRAFT_3122179 [Gautieria morchelliformis]|nr:hypothetical protein JB92DRAFT_3122179 [Gautieria morchelliformis]